MAHKTEKHLKSD